MKVPVETWLKSGGGTVLTEDMNGLKDEGDGDEAESERREG